MEKRKKQLILGILVPTGACIIYMALCMLNMTESIWFDESYSAYLTRGSFGDIWNMTSLDVHPPFFYFLLKIWSGIFGYTDFSMRFMSVFFGALGIILSFQLLKRWFGSKIAAVSTLALAVSPMLVRYGQEMRMYTLVFFIVVAATYALDLLLETKKTRYYIIYALLIAIGMWTHYFTAIFWIAHIIYYQASGRGKLFSKKMILMYVGAVLLFVPWMPSLLKQIVEVQSGFWIPAVSLLTPVDYAGQSLMYSEAEYATGWLALFGIGVVIFTTFFLRKSFAGFSKKQKQNFWLLITLVAVPPAILIILSLPPLASMFVDRYILLSSAYLWVLIGMALYLGFTRHKKLPLALILCGCVLGCAVAGVVNVTNRKSEGFIKGTVVAVKTIAEDGEPILVNNEWNYYDAVFYSTDEHPIYGVNSWINYQYGSIFPIQHIGYNLVQDVEEFTDEHAKIWYITDLNENTDAEPDKEILREKYQVVTTLADDHLVAYELERK